MNQDWDMALSTSQVHNVTADRSKRGSLSDNEMSEKNPKINFLRSNDNVKHISF